MSLTDHLTVTAQQFGRTPDRHQGALDLGGAA